MKPSILVGATKKVSFKGAPGLVISLTSLRVTPVVSPSEEVEAIVPSNLWPVLVVSVIVVPYRE